jgi:hypothetical protein
MVASIGGATGRRGEPVRMGTDRSPPTPVLSRLVIPLGEIQRESHAEVRGLAREWSGLPTAPGARIVSAERAEGAWIVWYVEGEGA